MDTGTRNIAIIIAFAGLIVLGLLGYFFTDDLIARADEKAVRAAVSDFGAHLKDVSPLSPDASSAIASAYRAYATPELLALWQKDPEKAPGRLASSPYPARIEISTITKQGQSYVVNSNIVLITSKEEATPEEDSAGTVPIILQLIKQDSGWLIAAYQEITAGPATD